MATSTAILLRPKQSRGDTYIAVRWAFWVEVLVYFGLVGVFVGWNYPNIDWNGWGFVSLLPQLVPSAAAAGLIGGLMTRHAGKGALPGIAMALFTLPCLGTLATIDAICLAFGFDPAIYPEVSSDPFINQLVWDLPALVSAACAAPMGTLGGYLGRKYLKVPKGVQLTPNEQMEKFLDAFKKPLFLLIFIVAWTPLIIPLFSVDDSVHKEYSAWNYGDSGTSEFRQAIEDAGWTNTLSSVGSYSLLSRIDEPFVLVIMGPNRFYNLVSDIPFLIKFVRSGGSLLVAHEQGTTEWLFLNMFIASAIEGAATEEVPELFPMTFFMDGILRDNYSYYKANDFPVIDSPNIVPDEVTAGVSKLVLNRASGLMLEGGMEAIFNWNVLATSTNPYSWVDRNDDGRYSRDDDYFDPYALGVPMILFEPLKMLGVSFPAGLPQGGMAIPVVASTELGGNSSRVVVTADASMFSNQLIDHPDYDNMQFSINCIDWLSRGNKSMMVVFDESHLRPVAIQDTSAAAVYGTVLDYVGFMSSNWLLAPFYPFIALKLLRRWLPKSDEQKRKLQERKRRREERRAKRHQRREKTQRQRVGRVIFEKAAVGEAKAASKGAKGKQRKTLAEQRMERKMQGMLKKSTFFAQKLAWYLEQPDFNRALELLYNRVKRLAGKKLGEQADDRAIISAIMERNPQVEQRRLETFFRLMRRVTARKGSGRQRITRAENLEKIYYELITVAEYLEKL
ncbi:MAG: hypothetical protein JW839_15430 [Candidatus Lokiarchaeota archaeon]|nr:hypothetical protein [Candidatus Lokiarchaeota archaeon]